MNAVHLNYTATTRRIQLDEDSWIEHTPAWLPDPTTNAAIGRQLHAELAWTQEQLHMFGKTVLQPRLTAVAGRSMDPKSRYRRPRPDTPWGSLSAQIRDAIHAVVADTVPGWTPNGMIANLYDPRSSISWHADNEPALGHHPAVASISLGATRRLDLRPGNTGPATITINLTDGDLLIMGGACQHNWQHRIAKTSAHPGEGRRLSLTFRHYQ